jgi:hypothetical protein
MVRGRYLACTSQDASSLSLIARNPQENRKMLLAASG